MNEINPKIDRSNTIRPAEPDYKDHKPLKKGTRPFDELLTTQLNTGAPTALVKQTAALPEIQGSFKAQQLDLELDRSQFARELTASLNLLETYAAWLENPEKTLKQAHGLLEQISAQTKNMAREFKEKEALDTELNHILTQLMSTVAVEQIKLNRGDYSS